MSTQATAWAYRCRVGNATAKAVLVYLADRASEDGTNAYPKVATICAVTEFKERAVRQSLKYLEDHGFIRRGDQRHAALLKHGHTRPVQYRQVVWDVCIDRDPSVSEFLAHTQHDEDPIRESSPMPDPLPDDKPRGAGDAPLHDPQACTSCTSGSARHAPLQEPPITNHPPTAPRKESAPGLGVSRDRQPAAHSSPDMPSPAQPDPEARLITWFGTLLTQQGIIVSDRRPRETRRDRTAAKRLLARSSEQEIKATAAWAASNRFWRPVILSIAKLDQHFERLRLQHERDDSTPNQSERQTDVPKDPHRAIRVTSSLATRVPVYGMSEFPTTASQAHLNGTIPEKQCPLCAFDQRNIPQHGIGLLTGKQRIQRLKQADEDFLSTITAKETDQ